MRPPRASDRRRFRQIDGGDIVLLEDDRRGPTPADGELLQPLRIVRGHSASPTTAVDELVAGVRVDGSDFDEVTSRFLIGPKSCSEGGRFLPVVAIYCGRGSIWSTLSWPRLTALEKKLNS